jgi:cell division protein FtsW (lipid II flippase)
MSDFIQSRLLRWVAIFLFIYSIILTLSPAVRERSWNVDYKLTHWVAYFSWLALVYTTHIASTKFLQERDPYIFPAAVLLSGWGLLTIWRLDPSFGVRQTIWFGISMTILIIAMRLPQDLSFLRRYKYILLLSGLLLSGLTLIFGANPQGIGPRLWLGCCGVYFQPSEPLKLLLVIYLAAYLSDRHPIRFSSLQLFTPTIVLTGIALLLLLVQRDLGTASIFIFLFTVIVFIVTGKKRVLLGAVILLSSTLLIGYFFIDIIRIRVDSWLYPWNDPAGHSYQIVQSLLAIANGGTTGRGPGLGSPLLVPVAVSDFIFAAIVEETGLVGTIGLIITIWLILSRGMIASLRATDRFRRFLGAGIVTYLGFQSLLIIGGNLRLVPLTGVTLPLVSYGGSSLVTSFIAIAILLLISVPGDNEPAALLDPKPYLLLTKLLGLGLAATALTAGWWIIIRGPDLLIRTDNARRAIADRYVLRGEVLDRNNVPINVTEGASGSYFRVYLYPDLAPVTGYTHPVYGQAGIEASLDPYLRGLDGNPARLIWWDHLLYGTPPPGLDIRLSIDLNLQSKADQSLGGHHGAIILMNAKTGEILAMASHPTYDPNKLDINGTALLKSPLAPLMNRSAQGLYPLGTALLLPLEKSKFGATIPDEESLHVFFETLGLYEAPKINIPASFDQKDTETKNLRASPLQVLLAAATLSNHGVIPSPRIAMAVNTPGQGWVVLPTEGSSVEVIQAEAADNAALANIVGGKPYWIHVALSGSKESTITWLIAGTLPDWGGTPLVLVVALEENNEYLARYIQYQLLDEVVR